MTCTRHASRTFSMLGILLFMVGSTPAVPTFQVYISRATTGDIAADDAGVAADPAFDLILIGTHQPSTKHLMCGALVVSVPQRQTGTITICTPATLLTTARITPFGANPDSEAGIDLLTTLPGHDVSTPQDTLAGNPGNCRLFRNDTYDSLILDVDNYSDPGPVQDYEIRTETITPIINGGGEEKARHVHPRVQLGL